MLFENVKTQFIDEHGKTRVLNYGNLSLVVFPLPPLDVPEKGPDEIKLCEVETALEFANKNNLEIYEQDGDETRSLIQGLWVKSKNSDGILIFGYIPINISDKPVKNIDYSPISTVNPIFGNETSELEKAKKNAKIANILKEYSLYEYSMDPKGFGKNKYHIKSNYAYDLTLRTNKFERITPFYYKNKIIVPDEITAEKLIEYVKITVYNNPYIVNKYTKESIIDSSIYYKDITDFRHSKNQLIFLDKNSLHAWKNNKIREKFVFNVVSEPIPWSKECYYYRNMNIKNGKLMMIQNTRDGLLSSAIKLSEKWSKVKINLGYDVIDKNVGNNTNFKVYTEKGLSHSSAKSNISVFGYNNGTYGAIMFL